MTTLDIDEDDRANLTSQARIARAKGHGFASQWLEQEGLACDSLLKCFGEMYHTRFVASDREVRLLTRRHPSLTFKTIENAIEIPHPIAGCDDGKTLVFVGSLGYQPNCDGLLWLANEVMPRLGAVKRGRWRLLIAGAHPPANILGLARRPCVHVLGRVDDLRHLYRKATLALAPMRSGGGTRIKLLEAAAHGVAGVFTDVALEGIDWPIGVGGWCARNAKDFAEACELGLSDRVERKRRASLARCRVANRHARNRVVARLAATLKNALSSR